MMAFDHVFLEIARNESRAIHTLGDAGAVKGTFLFRELYCADPGCDCRRVALQVQWVEKNQVAATINYALERPKRRTEPQLYLDPLNPPSDLANWLLDVFEDMIVTDTAYRETLRRHYKMWKAAVDDPSHPEHGKVHAAAHEDRSYKPAVRGRPPRTRARGGARPAGGNNDGLVRMVAKTSQLDSKLQQRFKKLLEKVEALRTRVHAWRQQRPDIDREIAKYEAAFAQQCRSVRELVVLLDRSCESGSFNKVDTKMLAEMICSMAGDLLEAADDDELKAIYKRHSRRDFDDENAELDLARVSELRSMMEAMGMDFGDAPIGSLEQLGALTGAQLDADEEATRERRSKRKKSAKQLANEVKRADEERSAHKAVQDVYRSLAKSLHPDREQDPVEQHRKAELMKEVNVAYESNDLLRLLELQLQLEGVDVARVDVLAEERVRHYTRVLDEQAKQLQIELEQLEMPFRMSLGRSPSSKLTPANVIARVHTDAEAVRKNIELLARDLKLFEDPSEIKRWLKTERRGRNPSYDRDADLFR